jgi:hypothetical protein
MKKILVFGVLTIGSINMYAQWNNEWFSTGLNIQPFSANILEARNGVMFALGEDRLRLDIGISKDIFQMKSDRETISFGADLFTYTRLRSENNFKFPVETIDYFFGLNAGYKKDDGKKEVGIRFRLCHISAHLVDGRYDTTSGTWNNGRKPIIYSKEFIELFPYFQISGFRVYIGYTYNYHIIPEIINKSIFHAGFDYYILSLSTQTITPFVAYDFKLSGIDDIYSGTSIAKMGVKFGNPLSSGFSILISYISGKSIHGELFDLNENYFNLGINLEL